MTEPRSPRPTDSELRAAFRRWSQRAPDRNARQARHEVLARLDPSLPARPRFAPAFGLGAAALALLLLWPRPASISTGAPEILDPPHSEAPAGPIVVHQLSSGTRVYLTVIRPSAPEANRIPRSEP